MKYYAVRKGKKTGIFTNWDETKANVDGYKGAEYKSFKNIDEAKKYMSENIVDTATTVTAIEPKGDYAFVDGSYNSDTKTYGYGGFVSVKGQKFILSGADDDPEYAKMHNVAGEIAGAVAAVKYAIQSGVKRLVIYYDYEGIEKWVTGEWKCNKAATASYRDEMQELIAKGIAIKFVKVPAHAGIEGNELADKLAKKAVGLGA